MSEDKTVVKEELTTPQSSEDTTKVTEAKEVATEPAQPGEKTNSAQLLNSLQTEREKRRLAEEKIKLLEEENTNSTSVLSEVSEEEKALESELSSIKSEVSALKEENTKKDLQLQYPVLKEKMAEFEEFRKSADNAGMSMQTAAKAYLAENGLLNAPRKGLEKSTGGEKPAAPLGKMTAQDVKTLREGNYDKYRQMLKEGKIIIAD